MQPSLSPLEDKHYRHYSQLFGVHNSLGEYFKYEGICHYNKNKSKNLERDLEKGTMEECVPGACVSLFYLIIFSMEATQLDP